MSMVFRKLSFVCGIATGAILTTKGLDYLETNAQNHQLSLQQPGYESPDLKLILVQVFFRHGARTPLKIIPGIQEVAWEKNELLQRLPDTDIDIIVKDMKNRTLPVENLNDYVLKGGAQMGQLTVVGQQETYDLGKKLRELYIDKLKFIDKEFDPKTTFLRTTHIPRTIDSLRCVVAGMFQDISEAVSFWTIPIKEEFLFPNWQTCSALRQYMKYCFKNAHRLKGYQNDMEKFYDIIGGSVQRLTFIDIMDDLGCRKAHNKPIPDKLKYFMNTIEQRSVQLFGEAYSSPPSWTNDLVLPLTIGPMVQHLCDNMKKKVHNTNSYKFCLFSVHDTSLFSLLCGLGAAIDKWPQFASYVTFELYKDNNEEHFVRLLYCGKVVKLKEFNEELIPLSKFEKICSRYYVDDMESACKTILHPTES